ncbi:MAG TPA: hypothetical protein VNB90_07970 [Cytophagaceae bacterium]|nr:hypothetical protein [Cytophagaceae bacterium]
MNKKKSLFYCVLLLLPLCGLLFHWLYLREAIQKAYEGGADIFTKFLLNTLYPRFEIEKHRFDLSFFLSKADQVVLRATLVYYVLIAMSLFYKLRIHFREKFDRFWYASTSSFNINTLRWLFFSYLIFLSYELCHDLLVLQPISIFYKPILWLRLLHIPFPNEIVVWILACCWLLINILILLRIRIVLFSAFSLCIFFLVQCWVFSFEKLDHSYATFTYAFLLLPFLFDEQKKNGDHFNSWSLQLIRFTIVMIYFLSGLEKLLISKFSWMEANTLKGYLSLHPTHWSDLIAQNDLLCVFISVFTLVFQVTFVLILFFPRYSWLWLLAGICFHTGTLVVMGIGYPLNPWWWVYIFFVDWEKIYSFLLRRFNKVERSVH